MFASNGTGVQWGLTEHIYRPLICTSAECVHHVSLDAHNHAFVPPCSLLIQADPFQHPHTASSVTGTSYTFYAHAVIQRLFRLHLCILFFCETRLRALLFTFKVYRPATCCATVTYAHSSAIDLVVSEPRSGSPCALSSPLGIAAGRPGTIMDRMVRPGNRRAWCNGRRAAANRYSPMMSQVRLSGCLSSIYTKREREVLIILRNVSVFRRVFLGLALILPLLTIFANFQASTTTAVSNTGPVILSAPPPTLPPSPSSTPEHHTYPSLHTRRAPRRDHVLNPRAPHHWHSVGRFIAVR